MVSMLEPSFRFSFAKIAFYTMRVKHKRLLCNIFKRKLLIYNMFSNAFTAASRSLMLSPRALNSLFLLTRNTEGTFFTL